MGTIPIRLFITESHFIDLLFNVVHVQIPFLLGLGTMRRFQHVLDTDNLRLSWKSEGWDVPLTNIRGQLYLEWKPEILFTQSKLVRIHRHFYIPNSEKLCSRMQRGVPEMTRPKVFRDPESIESTYELFQGLSHAPHRFEFLCLKTMLYLTALSAWKLRVSNENSSFMSWVMIRKFPQLYSSEARHRGNLGNVYAHMGFCVYWLPGYDRHRSGSNISVTELEDVIAHCLNKAQILMFSKSQWTWHW